jgi:hypothetical protein
VTVDAEQRHVQYRCDMRFAGIVAWVVLAWLAAAERSHAQAVGAAGAAGAAGHSEPDHVKNTIVVVVESAGGLLAANDLRRALGNGGCKVVTPGEAHRSLRDPDALLSVAVSPRHQVTVQYWDRTGQWDSLSGAVPPRATAEQLTAVVLALGSALFERHCQEMATDALSDVRRVWFDARRGARSLYAMLNRLEHGTLRSNVRLRFEDF